MSPRLSDASALRVGSTPVSSVRQGATRVWPPGVSLFSESGATPNQAVDADTYTLGTEFYVNKTGCYVTKVRYLQPTVGTTAARVMALWSTTDGTTGTKVGGDWTMPTPTPGQWCTYTLPTPIALTANLRYRVGYWTPGNSGFARQSFYFQAGAGNPGSTTTTIGGYLVRPNSADALGGTQGSNWTGGSLPVFPYSQYQLASYFADVVVTDVTP